jgi:hypothetical protein
MKQDWKNKFKDFSEVATTNKTELLVIVLSIYLIYRDA